MPSRSKNDRLLGELVGHRVRGLRLAADLSQAEVAERIGITQAALSNYEYGKRDMHLQTAVRLAAVFQIEVAVLLSGDDLPRDVYLLASRGPDYLGG